MAEHDPDRANELLDEMGLQWDAERNWRLRPDGERLSVLYINFRQEGPKWPIAELTKTYLEDIGIEMILKEVSRENNYLMHINNEFEMGGHHYDEGDFPRGWVSHAMAELQPTQALGSGLVPLEIDRWCKRRRAAPGDQRAAEHDRPVASDTPPFCRIRTAGQGNPDP